MEFINYLGDKNVATSMLLFARMSGFMVFFPFFSHNSIPIIIKTTFTLFLTMYLFPLVKLKTLHLDSFFIIQFLSKTVFGMIAEPILQIVFAIAMIAGERIVLTMEFTMASVLDPSSGTDMPITSQTLHLITLLFFFALDGHRLMLLFLSHSLGYINLGGFYPHENLMYYLNMGMLNIFVIGFTMSFPILGVSLLADTILELLVKTIPRLNLLVISYPIKITLGFVVLIAILLVMAQYFKDSILEVFTYMQTLFFA